MKKFFLFLALGAVLSLSNATAEQSPRVVQGKTFITYGKSSKDIPLNTEQERAFTVDAAIAVDIFQTGVPSLVIQNFPVGLSETKTVLLRPARPVADDQTQWTVGTKNGLRPIKAPRNVISYEGVIDGELKSKIFLTFFKGDLTGMIARDNGQRFVVAPDVKNYGAKHEHILSSQAHILDQMSGNGFVCGNSDNEAAIDQRLKEGDRTLASNELLEANVAVDITNSFYRRFNDYEKTQVYVQSLFGMVSRIYEEEINVVLHLNIVNIWDDINQDPYRGMSSGHELLPAMQKYWNANVNVPRNLAHLLSGPPGSSGGAQTVIGVAYLGQICQPTSAYGVSLIFNYNIPLPALTYINDVSTITHEIGHTFGSPHTHVGGSKGYEPPIDSCMTSNPNDPVVYAGDAANNGPAKPPSNGIGTIMSYCHLRFANTMQMTFGPRPQEKIRAGAERTGCLKAPVNPAIYMQYPVGKQNLIAGAQEEIRWTSARVTNVNLQYSTDGGANWIDIQTSVLATDRKIRWTVPQVGSTNVLVRVSDATNGQVYDQTEATLSIAKPTISITRPSGGERIGQKENITIAWNKQLVTSVNITYSTDGQTWLPIANDVSVNSYNWTAPEIVASQVVIRVVDVENGEIISESAPFAIGAATASIVSPNGGEKYAIGYNLHIAWTADFVNRIFIEYSTDNGTTWKNIRKPAISIDASLGYYKWTIPAEADTATGKVLLRIKNALQPDLAILDQTDGPFTFDLVSDITDVSVEPVGLTITGITPNPAAEEAYLQFITGNVERNTPVKIEIVDVTGRVVARFENTAQISSGEQTVKMNLKELPQGVYMLIVKDGMAQVSTSLRIVR